MSDQGLQDPDRAAAYTEGAWGLNNQCMDPTDRATAMAGLSNQQLGSSGVPPVNVSPTDQMPDGEQGRFNDDDWSMKVNPSSFSDEAVSDPATAGSDANTVYHESRHAEQDFDAARYQAGMTGESAEDLAGDGASPLPEDVAQAAADNPYNECNEDNANAETWWNSNYNHADDDKDYCDQPVEADAFDTANGVSDRYPGAEREDCANYDDDAAPEAAAPEAAAPEAAAPEAAAPAPEAAPAPTPAAPAPEAAPAEAAPAAADDQEGA